MAAATLKGVSARFCDLAPELETDFLGIAVDELRGYALKTALAPGEQPVETLANGYRRTDRRT